MYQLLMDTGLVGITCSNILVTGLNSDMTGILLGYILYKKYNIATLATNQKLYKMVDLYIHCYG